VTKRLALIGVGKSASRSGGPFSREYCDASRSTASPTCLSARLDMDGPAQRPLHVSDSDGACHQPGPLRGIAGSPRIAFPEAGATLRRSVFPSMSVSAERGRIVEPPPPQTEWRGSRYSRMADKIAAQAREAAAEAPTPPTPGG